MKNNITNALLSLLSKGIIRFTYRKVDGSIREAVGTRNLDIARDALCISIPNPKTGHNNPTAYYDLEKGDWRSFKAENVISINGIDLKDIKGVRGGSIVRVNEPIAVEIPINCDESEVIPIGSVNDTDFVGVGVGIGGGMGIGVGIGVGGGSRPADKPSVKPANLGCGVGIGVGIPIGVGGVKPADKPIEKGEPADFDLDKIGGIIRSTCGKVATPILTEKGVAVGAEIKVDDFAKLIAHYVVEELISRIK